MEKDKIYRIIDLHLEERAGVPSNREQLWEELGEWQLDSLLRIGLQNKDSVLDIGCGPLRFGSYAIPFLDDGNYHGVEVWKPYESLGKRILDEFGISKNYSMIIDTNFDYTSFNRTFNFAIAQSVITHMSVKQIDLLFNALKKVMEPGGKFLFTYINNRIPYGVYYEMEVPMITPSNLDASFFNKLESKYDIKFEDRPSSLERHPTGQAFGYFVF